MPELTTAQMITIGLVCLASLALLLALIGILWLSKVSKRLSDVRKKSLELQEKDRLLEAADRIESFECRLDESDSRMDQNASQLAAQETKLNEHASVLGKAGEMMGRNTTGLSELADRISAVERRFDGYDNKVAERLNQFAGLETKLSEHDAMLAKAGQMMGKNAANLAEADRRMDAIAAEVQSLKKFQSAAEETRDRIMGAFGAMRTGMSSKDALSTEREMVKPDGASRGLGEGQRDAEDLKKSWMLRYP